MLNEIDPDKKYIKYRLYRNSCIPIGNTFIKDLNTLGRDIEKTIIVDNSALSFGYNVKNSFNKNLIFYSSKMGF